MGCLYRILFDNGKSYIGITTKSAKERLASHRKSATRGSSLLVHKAMRKYKFDMTVIEESNDIDKLCFLEIEAIKKFNSLSPSGYNLTTGGDKSYTYCDSVKEKISRTARGNKRRVGTKHSEESKLKMKIAKQGNKLSEETKSRMSESRKKFYSVPENLEALVASRKMQAKELGEEKNSERMKKVSAARWSK